MALNVFTKTLLVGVGILALSSCSESHADINYQSWQRSIVEAETEAISYTEGGATVWVAEVESIYERRERPEDDRALLEDAMSVMAHYAVDLWDVRSVGKTSSGHPLISGVANIDQGRREARFAATLQGKGDDMKVVVFAAAPSRFDDLGGAELLKVERQHEEASAQPASAPPAGAAAQMVAPPESFDEVETWPRQESGWQVQSPEEVHSPRYVAATTGPKYDVFTFNSAVANFAAEVGLKFRQKPELETLEAWREWDGRDLRIALGRTDFEGREGIAFILVSKLPDEDTFAVNAYEMDEATYQAWGAIVRIMVLRGILPGMGAFPEEQLPRTVDATLSEQVALYEATLNKQLEAFGAAMTMQAQSQALMTMQELNYDLLFGNDLTPGPGVN